MTPREMLEKEIASAYNDQQLDTLVRSVLQKPLNHIVAKASVPIMVTELMNALEREQSELIKFILQLRLNGPTLEIRGAASNYFDNIFGTVTPQVNPYKDLIVLGHPFADRQSFRDKLKALLALQYNRTLSVNGPRYCGRSHSRVLVRHVGQTIGIRVAFIDLLKTDVSDAISYLINEMQLDVKDVRDRMAQFSTQTKGFLSALRGIAQTQFLQTNTRWCIVFDHHDLLETPPERKEFAEAMIQELIENTLPNIWVIMLGLGTCQFLTTRDTYNILNVDLLPLGLTDIETYINELYIQKHNRPMEPTALQAEREKVLADLQLPLASIESMETMSLRLRQYI